jgi:hypothetical protein
VFEIEVPDGSHGAVVRPDGHDSEYEVLLQRNSHFIVKSIDLNKRKVYVTLDQSAAAKAGK